MSGLVGVHCDISAIASLKLVPSKTAGCVLYRSSVVLRASKSNITKRVVSNGMNLRSSNVAVDRDPFTTRRYIWADQAKDPAVCTLQEVAHGVKDDRPRVSMRRRAARYRTTSIRTVTVDASPGVDGQQRCVATKSVAAEAGAAVDIRERGVLPVASDEDDARIHWIGCDGAVYVALPTRMNSWRRNSHCDPCVALICRPEDRA